MASPWTATEREAWRPPPAMTVSEWADTYRELAPGTSSEPGRWRTERNPPMREIQDCMGDPDYEEVVLMTPPQVGKSEATRNCLGRWIDHDPAPCLMVYPSEQSAREMIDERVVPMIYATPQLRRYLTGVSRDVKLRGVKLRTMPIYTGTASSPQSLASRPVRYVICDEVDKYPRFSGREADPVGLAEARTRTYGHRRKLISVSTPTTVEGAIARLFRAIPDKRYYHVKCPVCQHEQQLLWEQVRWEGGLPDEPDERFALSQRVDRGAVKVWLECVSCQVQINETLKHKLLLEGRWISSGERGRRVAFHLNALYSPWVSWARVVTEYLRSRETLEDQMRFVNQWLGQPFEERLTEISADVFDDKATTEVLGELPAWAELLTMSVDTQKDSYWWVVRAWGPGRKTQLVDYGRAYQLSELDEIIDKPYQSRTHQLYIYVCAADSGGGVKTVDGGNTTDMIYKWGLRRRNKVWPIKGGTPNTPVATNRVTYRPRDGVPYDVLLRVIDTQHYKDVLAARMVEATWTLPTGVGQDYHQQLRSEHKVLVRKGTTAQLVWQPITRATPNHLWDCEVYQSALADMLQVYGMNEAHPQARTAARPRNEVRMPDGRPFLANWR